MARNRRAAATVLVAAALLAAGCEAGDDEVVAAAATDAIEATTSDMTSPDTSVPPPTEAPTTTPPGTEPPPPPTQPPLSDDEIMELAYVVLVRTLHPTFAVQDDATLIELGHTVCKVIAEDAGGDVRTAQLLLAVVMVGDGYDEEFIGAVGGLMGAAVAAFCPEYESQL